MLLFFAVGAGALPHDRSVADLRNCVCLRKTLPERQPRAEAPGQRVEISHLRPLLGIRERCFNHVRVRESIMRGRGPSLSQLYIEELSNSFRVPPSGGVFWKHNPETANAFF